MELACTKVTLALCCRSLVLTLRPAVGFGISGDTDLGFMTTESTGILT